MFAIIVIIRTLTTLIMVVVMRKVVIIMRLRVIAIIMTTKLAMMIVLILNIMGMINKGSYVVVPRPKTKGIPEIMVCSVLLLMRSFGSLFTSEIVAAPRGDWWPLL